MKTDLTVSDLDDQGQSTTISLADVNCQLGSPAYNPSVVADYQLTCQVVDAKGNLASLTRTISVVEIDDTPLKALRDRIVADFADRADKITNPDADDQPLREIQAAIDNPNLTTQQMNALIAKYENLRAERDTTNPTGEITPEPSAWTN